MAYTTWRLIIKKEGKLKTLTILKTTILMSMLPSAFCFAVEVPSNTLQVEYQNNNTEQTSLLSFDTVYQIPSTTYNYLDDIFTSFYHKLTFNTSISDSTFEENSHYELLAIPLITENDKGFQLELFGNFSDIPTKHFSNMSSDQALSNYYSNTKLLDIYESEFSVGAGISFNTGDNSKIKVIISNNDIPGYGSSNALFGFETSF